MAESVKMEDKSLKEIEDRFNAALTQQGEIIANLTLRITALEKTLLDSKVVDRSTLIVNMNEIGAEMNKAILDAIERHKSQQENI